MRGDGAERRSVVHLLASAMDLSRRDFRAMIYSDFNKDLNVDQCREPSVRVFGDSAQSRATIGNWLREFRRGRG